MTLIWNPYKTGAYVRRPAFFMPDRIENFRHDASPDQSMVVRTADGMAVCGRHVPGSTDTWEHVLDPHYELVETAAP